MSRLTKRNESGYAFFPACFQPTCEGFGCRKEECAFLTRVCEKLAYYEDLEQSGRLLVRPAAAWDSCGACVHFLPDKAGKTSGYCALSRARGKKGLRYQSTKACRKQFRERGKGTSNA